MKKILFLLAVIGFISLHGEVIDRIAAIVGNEIILESEIVQLVSQQKMYGATQPDSTIRKEILNGLISTKVIYDIAQKDTTITVDEKEVENELSDRINNIISRIGGEKALEEKYNTSVAKLKSEYRPEITKSLFVEKLKQKRLYKEKISKPEVEAFFKEFRDSLPDIKETVALSQLFISFDSKSNRDEATIKELLRIKDLILKDSITFEDAAKKYSADPGSAVNGGDLGLTFRDDLVPEYGSAAYNLEPGQISQPVKSEFGFHLIKLQEKVGEKIRSSHILLKPEIAQENDQAALNKITVIADSIANKFMTFEECVKKYSDDEKSKATNGMIGNMLFDDLDQSFKDAFLNLKSGDISKPVKQEKGYSVFKIMDRETAHKVELNRDFAKLKEWALNRKREKAIQKWVEELKKNVYIEIK